MVSVFYPKRLYIIRMFQLLLAILFAIKLFEIFYHVPKYILMCIVLIFYLQRNSEFQSNIIYQPCNNQVILYCDYFVTDNPYRGAEITMENKFCKILALLH